ncbi:acyl-CoA thioesterase [Calothrix rhizosoleniae]|uniref:acyl-CoA thioesterase n=1 Tax=Calothrix rhizosoleniae TaxID=888997 RepID=UPI000B497C6A|nr:thioesterase family protein [Calothrix rhizosoleniae]
MPTKNPQLPPNSPIDSPALHTFERWFEYPVRAQPHHTDYAGVVWHGNYIKWMEEARVEYLRSVGIEFADLVALGCDLPVVELSIRYHKPIKMGMAGIVKTRMELTGVRMNWDYAIVSRNEEELFVSAKVVLVPVDREKSKIMRQLPAVIKDAFAKILERGEN